MILSFLWDYFLVIWLGVGLISIWVVRRYLFLGKKPYDRYDIFPMLFGTIGGFITLICCAWSLVIVRIKKK